MQISIAQVSHKHYIYIYLLPAIGLSPGGSSTVHIYTQTIHRTAQLTNWEECGPCSVFVNYTLALALQLRKKHGKTSLRVAEECQLARWKQNIQNRTYIAIRIYKINNKNTWSRFQTFAVVWILYMFFWVFPRCQIVVGRRFGTLYQFHLQRLDVNSLHPAFEDGTDTRFRNVGQLQFDAGEIPKRTY